MSKKITIDEIKKRFEDLDAVLISSEYHGYNTKLQFICNKHRDKGIQETTLRNISRHMCCHYCGKEKMRFSRKVPDDELKHITESVGFIYIGNKLIDGHTKIVYRCKSHLDKGDQYTSVAHMKKSKGFCPYCLNRYRSHEDFQREIFNINPNINILNKFENTDSHIQCQCKICGHVWENSASNLLHGQGCKICASRKLAQNQRHNQAWFDEQMLNIHPNIETLTPYITAKDKVLCKCKLDGYVWETTPDRLINLKCGCRKCSDVQTRLRCVMSHEEFVQKLFLINPNIVPLEKYININTKIKCLCTKHNYIWHAQPAKILKRKTGCPKCAVYHNENMLIYILDKWGYKYELQKKFNGCKDINLLPFDVYLLDYNTCIEYDGEQHYMPIKFHHMSDEELHKKFTMQIKHDYIKDEFCYKNHINLIRIPYWEKENMEYFLFDKFVHLGIIEENID